MANKERAKLAFRGLLLTADELGRSLDRFSDAMRFAQQAVAAFNEHCASAREAIEQKGRNDG